MADPRQELRWFARRMEDELRANDHKGGWHSCGDGYLLRRIADERAELGRALRKLARKVARGGTVTQKEIQSVVAEAADVANFAMMIADNWKYFVDNHEPVASALEEPPRE